MRLATFVLPLCLVACRSDQDMGDEDFLPVYDYSGPPLRAELTDDASGHVLHCTVDPPTPGHRMTYDRKERDGDTLLVYATLRHPAPDAVMSDEPLEPVQLAIPLDDEFMALELHVAKWMEGVNYVHPPVYQQALRLEHVH